jgi:hypothetical protein
MAAIESKSIRSGGHDDDDDDQLVKESPPGYEGTGRRECVLLNRAHGLDVAAGYWPGQGGGEGDDVREWMVVSQHVLPQTRPKGAFIPFTG